MSRKRSAGGYHALATVTVVLIACIVGTVVLLLGYVVQDVLP
jgi:hypothetical protein